MYQEVEDAEIDYFERKLMNNPRWEYALGKLDFAFQPIVNIHTGVTYGFEALIRNHIEAGFKSIQNIFDEAFRDQVLIELDLHLRKMVLNKFTQLNFSNKVKIFYNIDNRILLMPDYNTFNFSSVIGNYILQPDSFCFEISEKFDFFAELKLTDNINQILTACKQTIYKTAIDDFGSGLSGLQLLYHSEPDYIKIDRFFISGIADDSRKKLFVSSTLKMAHVLGIIVIAEGVETEKEFLACKEIGCDYIQGYLIQRPATNISELYERYEIVSSLNQKDKRDRSSDQKMISVQMEYIAPVPLYREKNQFTDMETVFETFRKNKFKSFFPVTSGNGEPIGVIREKDLKEYVYSPYGKEILKNKTSGNITKFVTKIPISEINTRVEKILEIFAANDHSEGILLTENSQYVGFLSASSIIKLLNEKNIAEARDQNPLTKLPGNNIINQYIAEALEENNAEHVFVYYDLDNFKPFNDKYGFRQGDRVILLFSDILKEITNRKKAFIGHIGGDDFFAAFKTSDMDMDEIMKTVTYTLEQFRNEVLSIYSSKDREKGYIYSTNREGKQKKFKLLSVSAGIIIIKDDNDGIKMEDMFSALAELKKEAKASAEKYSVRVY
jgi:diguanylate cyclase (GGDEF)-like protein